jgi:hypothetical protein
MPVTTRLSLRRITQTQNSQNVHPLATPNIPTVPVAPMAPKPLSKTSSMLTKELLANSDSNTTNTDKLQFGCCCICCEDIASEKGRYVLDCGHTFHGNCILTSLFKYDSRCPLCRTNVEVVENIIKNQPQVMLPSSLRIYSSIISTAADHFIEDMGNITLANVIHRMLLMSSDNPDMRSIQIPYIKRILTQFATMLFGGIAFTIRHGPESDNNEIQDPVPIVVVDNEDPLRPEDEYDAALSNPAIDAAVSYESIISSDLNFEPSQTENVTSILLRRAIALSELGSQRADLSLRRAVRASTRRQQMQLVQQHLRTEMLRRQAVAEQHAAAADDDAPHADGADGADGGSNSDNETVIMMGEGEGEGQEQQQDREQEQEQEENPWGPQF